MSNLTEQYKSKEVDFDTFKRDYGIRLVSEAYQAGRPWCPV
jgi:hypothetical protein